MKILLTGATGYIGKRLLPALVQNGHEVVCCTRDKRRLNVPSSISENVSIIEVDFLEKESLSAIPKDIEGAFYLLHSMASSSNYEELELKSAKNFLNSVQYTKLKHVIYLTGIINDEKISRHLASRKAVEDTLSNGSFKFTAIRAGIIIGSGSASFEIIRDLVEKLPVMVAPKWVNTRCQPIGVKDVINILIGSLFNEGTYDNHFDIGGPDIMTYKEMLLVYAKVRKLHRRILIVPVLTPRLSSLWLHFVTSTTYKLASALVDSMKVEVVAKNNDLIDLLSIKPVSYWESLKRTTQKIEENQIVSSWTDAWASSVQNYNISDFIRVPTYGCFKDYKERKLIDREFTLKRIWSIGGNNGWYYGNWMWSIRGYLDQLVGGVGLRRGRKLPSDIKTGEALDFWRVLYSNKEEGRLLLFAEMKLPGDAWLEFKIEDEKLIQTATFRPKGIAGRLYWYSVLPLHGFVFNGMINALINPKN